jgi:hypothetical protein
MSKMTFALAMMLPLLAIGAPAKADDAAPNARRACMPSAKTLCATEVAAMDRQAVKLCLWKNIDRVSPDCREAIKAIRATHGEAPPPTQTH